MSAELSENELATLKALAGAGEEMALYFRGIANRTGLNFVDIRVACRSLASRGLAQHVRGLFDADTGLTAGSGYSLTDAGRRHIEFLEGGAA